MKPTQPCLAVRFDIEKVEATESLFYGRYCWKILFRAILGGDGTNRSLLAEAKLYEGDSAQTLAGKEYVYALAIESPNRDNLNRIKNLLAKSDEFQKFADPDPFHWDNAVDGEPLPTAGVFNRDAVLETEEGRISNPKVVLDELFPDAGPMASAESADLGRLVGLAEKYIRMEPPSDAMAGMMAEVLGEKPGRTGYRVVAQGAIERSGNLMNDMQIISVARFLKEKTKDIPDSAGPETVSQLVMQAVMHYLELEPVRNLFLAPHRKKSGKPDCTFTDLPDEEKCRVLTGMENLLLEIYGDLPDGGVITDETILTKVGKVVSAGKRQSSASRSQAKPKRGPLATLVGYVAIIATSVLVLAIPVGAIWGFIHWKRSEARQREMLHDLKLLQMSFDSHALLHSEYPPAAILSTDGKPLLSWRVALLPHLGEEGKALFQRFELGESWDSPHNLALLSEMPKDYQSWDKVANAAHSTHYRVFVHEPGTDDDQPKNWPPFSLGSPKGLQGISIARKGAILCVESTEAVPWAKPTGLRYGTGIPLPELGGQVKGGFCAVTMDGEKEFIRQPFNEAELRSRIQYGRPDAFAEIRAKKESKVNKRETVTAPGGTGLGEPAAEDPEKVLRKLQQKQQNRLKRALELPKTSPPPK